MTWAVAQSEDPSLVASLAAELATGVPSFSAAELIEILEEEPDLAGFYVALGLLYSVQPPAEIPAVFGEGLRYPDSEVRMSALKGLTLIGTPEVARLLKARAPQEIDAGIRSAIATALERLTEAKSPTASA